MKITSIIIFVFIFSACSKKHNNIKIINEGNLDLLYYYTKYDIVDVKQINYVEYLVHRIENKKVQKIQTIGRTGDLLIDSSFETYIGGSPEKQLEVFAFTLDTLFKYRKDYKINYLINNKLYYKKVNLTIDTLNELNWIVTIK
ncbi:MAG: hypothetical protein JNJ40_05920 [Bacteroidia bacterium]|nr:hypothetical protein [Bacteroidia bacterium]